MRLFITATYFKSGGNKEEVDRLCNLVSQVGFEFFCFVKEYGEFDDPAELTRAVKKEIEKSDVLLFDATKKSTGRMLATGIAFGLKKIIVIVEKGVLVKEMVRGVASAVIEYNVIEDIAKSLKRLLVEWEKG